MDYKRGKDEEIGAWIGKSLKRIEREKGRELGGDFWFQAGGLSAGEKNWRRLEEKRPEELTRERRVRDEKWAFQAEQMRSLTFWSR